MARKEKEQEVNIINPKYYEDKRKISVGIWLVPFIVMILACVMVIIITICCVYEREKKNLEVETYVINDKLEQEFDIAINSINLNGYMEIFEQYLKTSLQETEESIYYNTAKKTLDNITNISDNIVTTFLVSFDNKEMILSGGNKNIITNYEYENEMWYDYKKISQNKSYISRDSLNDIYENEHLLTFIRPIVDNMNDRTLGIVAFSYKEEYIKEIFDASVKGNLQAVVYTDTGKIILDTNKEIYENIEEKNINRKKFIYIRKTNESLKWTVETQLSIHRVIINSMNYVIKVIIIFTIMIFLYLNLIRNLIVIKVIDKKGKILVEEESKNNKENETSKRIGFKSVVFRKLNERNVDNKESNKDEDEELAIEDVLNKDIENEESIIDAGEIIFDNKKWKKTI